MEIEIVTTKKKLTKSIVKQFDLADPEILNNTIEENKNTEFFRVRDVFKFEIVIFKNSENNWFYYPLHKYSLSKNKSDVLIYGGRHMFFNNNAKAEKFIKNIDFIKNKLIKIFI